MLQPKRTAVFRLAKIFIQGNVLLCYTYLTNLFVMHRLQHPRILGNHCPWAVYSRSCSISFSEISLTWHGTCLLLYDNLCLEYSIILCFPISPLLFSLSSFSLSLSLPLSLSQRLLLLVSFSYSYSLVAVARMGEERGCIGSWWGNRRERDHWGDLGVDGWIVLGWISRRWDVGIWTGLGWPRIETSGERL